MTVKYLYIANYNTANNRLYFKNCHCPMDSILMDFVFESYKIICPNKKPEFTKDKGWSTIRNREGGYDAFQGAITTIIEQKKLDIIPIEFDYKYWEDAKNIHENPVKNKREKLKELWNEQG